MARFQGIPVDGGDQQQAGGRFGGDPAAAPARGGRFGGIPIDQPSPDEVMAERRRGALQAIADEMPWYERLAAGMGRGATEVGQAVKQIGLHTGGAIGLLDPDTIRQYDRDVADEAALWEQGAGNTAAGKVGSLIGSTMVTAPVGGAAIGAAGKVAGKAGLGALESLMTAPAKSVAQAVGKGVASGAATAPLSAPTTDPEGDFLAQKLEQAGVGAATGGGLGGILHGAGRLARELISKNLPFRRIGSDAETPAAQQFLQESERLAQDTGVPFTPGQATGSKGLTAMENAARQSSKTADRVFAVDDKAATAFDNYVGRILDGVSKGSRSSESAGEELRKAMSSKISAVEATRKRIADQEYGDIRRLAGESPIIEPGNLRAALSDIAAEYGTIPTPGAEALKRFADKTVDGELGDVTALMNLRQYLGKVAGGQAKISGEPVDRKIAAQMVKAIDDDLDGAVDKLPGDIGTKLRNANQNFRNFSSQIEYLRTSPLGKLLGEDVTNLMTGGNFNTIPPEKLIERLKTMKPSEVRLTRDIMSDASPEAWQVAKRQLIEGALETAREAAPSAGANTLTLQATSFMRALGGHRKDGEIWGRSLFEPKEWKQLQDAFAVARRLGDRTGYNHSGTAQQIENLAEMNAPQTAMGWIQRLATAGASKVFRTRLAEAMESPDGRKMLLELKTLKPRTQRAMQIARQLGVIEAGDVQSSNDTRAYQDRLQRAKGAYDGMMRDARASTPDGKSVSNKTITRALHTVSERFGVGIDDIMNTPDTPAEESPPETVDEGATQ